MEVPVRLAEGTRAGQAQVDLTQRAVREARAEDGYEGLTAGVRRDEGGSGHREATGFGDESVISSPDRDVSVSADT